MPSDEKVPQRLSIIHRVSPDDGREYTTRIKRVETNADGHKTIFLTDEPLPLPEEWTAMSEAERIALVRTGYVTGEQWIDAFRNGSDELREAALALYRHDSVQRIGDYAFDRHGPLYTMFEKYGNKLRFLPRSEWGKLKAEYEHQFEGLPIADADACTFAEVIDSVVSDSVRTAKAAILSLDIDDTADFNTLVDLTRKERPQWSINDDITPVEMNRLYLAELNKRIGEEEKKPNNKHSKRPAALPTTMPQQTWPEARNMAIALADGPSGRGWQDIVGEIALSHGREDDPIQIKLIAGPSIDWWGMPATYGLLRDELREAGVDAALLLNEVLYLALEHPGQMFSLDSLIEAIGWDPRSASEKNECRRWIWRKVSLFENMLTTGQRRWLYSHPDTKKKVPVAIVDRLVVLGPRLMPEQKAFDNSEPPFEISFKPGEHLEQYRGNRKVLTDYGDVRRIAEIPAKQASGKWARGIGLALNQFWRQSSKAALITHVTDGGKTNRQSAVFRPFTRRELLTEYYIANPHVEDILNGPNPKRAREYWDGAIKHLKRKGVIGSYTPKAPIRDGDKSAWLDQPLDIRPANEGLRDTIEIAKAQARRKRSASKAANKN